MKKASFPFFLRLASSSLDALDTLYKNTLTDFTNRQLSTEQVLKKSSLASEKYSYIWLAEDFDALKNTMNTAILIEEKHHSNITMLFTGQGAQYPNMGKALYDTIPFFKIHIDTCIKILKTITQLDLYPILFSESTTAINQTEYTQPALFIFEYAMAALWQYLGVQPQLVIGHSVGEYPAATIAGYLTLEEGIRLIAKRASLMQSLPQDGTMAAILASAENVQKIIHAHDIHVDIAAYNAPLQTVISGDISAVETFCTLAKKQRIKAVKLQVSHAFHSYKMDPILSKYKVYANDIITQSPTVPLISNVTGGIATQANIDAAYWSQHIRKPVRFMKGIQTAIDNDTQIFIEVGPQPFLSKMAEKTVGNQEGYTFVASAQSKGSPIYVFFDALIQIARSGITIEWKKLLT